MWQLTHEGTYVKTHGSPEFRVYNMVNLEQGIGYEIIKQELGYVGKNGYEICLKNNYLEYDCEKKLIFRKKEFLYDMIQFYLLEIDKGFNLSKKIMNMLKKRNLIEKV